MMNGSTIDAELNDETNFIANSSSTAASATETRTTTTTETTRITETRANEHKQQQQQQQPILQWKTTKKRSRRRQQQPRDDNVLQSEESILLDKNRDWWNQQFQQDDGGTSSEVGVVGPLIIPVAPDQNKWKQKQQQQQQEVVSLPQDHASDDVVDDEDIRAIQALHDDAVVQKNRLSSEQQLGTDTHTTKTTIPSHANKFVAGGGTATIKNNTNNNTTTNNATSSSSSLLDDREVQQYHKDIEALPSALDETAEEYQRVPISEFGAALLRGMGWKDDAKPQQLATTTTTNDDIMPRPHRLGLGAIPAMLPEPKNGSEGGDKRRRPRNIDQYQRDQRTQKQHDMYRMERETKLAQDLQRTLQDGSIVHLVHQENSNNTTQPQQQQQQRARILKLVGVPGLNMVQVQMEHTGSSIVIKRNEIDGLVTREELNQNPFREKTVGTEINSDRTSKQATHPRYDEQKNNHQERAHSRADKKRSRNEKYEDTMNISWVIPNIRVRIVTEKLGPRYYKEKGIVVDVTRNAGVTLKLNNHSLSTSASSSTSTPAVVLDRIPERYLETALPKTGGSVIVVNPRHTNKYAKGRLIERDSTNKNYGIVQLYDDMDCIRLPLDDIAEWCGPLDDDDTMP